MRFYCFVASLVAYTGIAHAYNLAQKSAGLEEEAIFDDHQLAETYLEKDGDPPAAGSADATADTGTNANADAKPKQ